jgi:hypothetical protein
LLRMTCNANAHVLDPAASVSKFQTKLPRTSNSQGLSYAILIHRICPQRSMGDVFEGRRLRPGATLPETELWPTADHPETPLLLEYVGSDRSGSGHRRSQHLYILWQYRKDLREWIELARTRAEALEWVEVLKTAAMRHVSAASTIPARSGAASATSRVLTVLEYELETLAVEDRRNLLGLLYEQFTARLIRDGVADSGTY